MSIYGLYLCLIVPVSYACFLLLRVFSLSFIYNTLPEYFTGGFTTSITVTTVLLAALCIISYFITKPFDSIIKKIKNENYRPTEKEVGICLNCFKNLNRLTFGFYFLGFFVGQIVVTGSGILNGLYGFDSLRFSMIILQAVSFGGMGAILVFNGLDNRLGSYRRLLKIHDLKPYSKQKSLKISTSIIMTFAVSIFFVGINMLTVIYGSMVFPQGSNLSKGIGCLVVAMALSTVAFVFVIHGLSSRMKDTGNALDKIALEGDLTQRVDITVLDDFGNMTTSLNTMIKKLSVMIKALIQQTSDVSSAADVISSSATDASGALDLMTDTLHKINHNSTNQNNLIHQADENILRLTNAVENVKKRVVEQNYAVESISSSIDEMSANINSVAETAKKAQVTSEELSSTTELGQKSIQNAIASMNQIQTSSTEVQKMVNVIQEIARETNLLSMNAAIEAAHAGSFGAGFAVVADEVRNLAESSGKSAKAIQNSIKDMAEKINTGVEAISSAGSSFANIAQKVEVNAQYVNNISAAMEEQKVGASETQRATVAVVDTVKAVNDLAQDETRDAELVREFMKTVVSASESTMKAVSESFGASDNLKKSIHQVEDSAQDNKSSVDTIQVQVNKFSV